MLPNSGRKDLRPLNLLYMSENGPSLQEGLFAQSPECGVTVACVTLPDSPWVILPDTPHTLYHVVNLTI